MITPTVLEARCRHLLGTLELGLVDVADFRNHTLLNE